MKTLSLSILILLFATLPPIFIYVYEGGNIAAATATGEHDQPKPDNPEPGLEYWLQGWRDENGEYPPNPIELAIQQRDDYLAQFPDPDGFGDDHIATINWTTRGPTNIGGRTRSVIVHPNNPSIIWAGSVGGGVFKSDDGGQTWTASNSTLQNFAIGSMAIDPQNPDVLYAGTGEGFFYGDSLRGGGIFRTADGGMNWERLERTRLLPVVNRIAVSHIGETTVILAAVTGGGDIASGGIIRSTNDGQDWSITTLNTHSAFDVKFDPNDSTKAVADLYYICGFAEGCCPTPNCLTYRNRVVFSNNGGSSWSDASRAGNQFWNDDRIELAYAKSEPGAVYALYKPSVSPTGLLSKSLNGGQTFSSGLQSINVGTLQNTLWVSPASSNFLVVGNDRLWRTTDSGVSYTQIHVPEFLLDDPHHDQHCVVSDPGFNGSTNKKVYVCNDGGVYTTNDITTAGPHFGWHQLNLGFQTTQYYGASGSGTTGTIYGGTQDNGSPRLVSASTTAALGQTGDGGFGAVDPTDNYCYGNTQPFNEGCALICLHRWSNCASLTGYQDIYSNINEPGGIVFPYILDPNNSNTMLLGLNSVWRTQNVKAAPTPTWTPIKSPEPGRISAIAVAEGNSDIIWVAEADGDHGKVYRTEEGTKAEPTWITVDDNTPQHNVLPDRRIERIVIDKDNHNKVYVAMSGFEPDNIQVTFDSGISFESLTGPSIPEMPIRGIARHPNDPNKLYAGTEIGVYASTNGGGTWMPVMDGPANVSIAELNFMSNSQTLLAATHGRGIWTADVSGGQTIHHTPYDFDGDGRSDVGVFRPDVSPSPNGTWYFRRSSTGFLGQQFGLRDDIPAVEDFDGDGRTDIGVFRPSSGMWYWIRSSNGTVDSLQLGQSGDVPVPADFDGDGKADQGVFHPDMNDGHGYWRIHPSGGGPDTNYAWGKYDDLPVAADFDGQNGADYGVFRLKDGNWWLIENGNWRAVQWGQVGDIPSAADYTGDGIADIAIFRPVHDANTNRGDWWILTSLDPFTYQAVTWGYYDDVPVPADYDGDGKADIAVFRPSEGIWHLRQSTNGYRARQFGASTDIPIEKRRFTGTP